jgi:hypothetical protein
VFINGSRYRGPRDVPSLSQVILSVPLGTSPGGETDSEAS